MFVSGCHIICLHMAPQLTNQEVRCFHERHVQREATKTSTTALFPSPRKVILFYRQLQISSSRYAPLNLTK